MHLKVLLLSPEGVGEVENILKSLFPRTDVQVEYLYYSIPLSDEELEREWEKGIEEKIARLPRPVEVLNLSLPLLYERLLHPEPPALLVIAYRRFTSRFAEVLMEIVHHQYPTLLLPLPEL